MMYSENKIILIDFGASRVKSILIDSLSQKIIDAKEVSSPSLKTESNVIGHFEIPVKNYFNAFSDTALALLDKHPDVSAIYICSEMHGFALLDKDTNEFLPYISWKDNRIDIAQHIDSSTWFIKKTGMKLRPGLPFLNLKYFNFPQKNYKFFTLVDAILYQISAKNIKSDYSLAVSTGLVDINTKSWSNELYKFNNIEFHEINFDHRNPIAEFGSIKIFGGIGDLQSAILGTGITDNAIINLGTGSQVICKGNINESEIRPVLDDYLKVITHIPSGRALNILNDFFNSITNDNFFWDHWAELNYNDVINADNNVDLNMFESAYNYSSQNGFIKFREGRSNFKLILSDIAKSWVLQYINILNKLDDQKICKTVKVAGGLAHKSKFLIPAFNTLDPSRNYKLCSPKFGEETLDGLFELFLKK